MNKSLIVWLLAFPVLAAAVTGLNIAFDDTESTKISPITQETTGFDTGSSVPQAILANFTSDLENNDINWNEVVSGGVRKDGIPSIDNPNFKPIATTTIPQDTEGLLLEIDGQSKFYPYNILVRHEIVNDSLAGTPVAVTFCPLCGSGIVFDRRVADQTLEFGVSGFLRESNMIMYDRETESLWQQALGRSFAGDLNQTQLGFLPVELLTLAEVAATSPDAQILTTETGIPGYSDSSYTGTPYGSYDEDNDYFIFRPSSLDARFPSKEIFQIVPVGEYSVAVRRENLENSQQYTYQATEGIDLTIDIDEDGRITPTNKAGEEYPTYFEMWFSWAVQHKGSDKTIVWEPELR